MLTTTRQVTATGLGEKASIEWSNTDRTKKGLQPSKVELKAVRERWAVLTDEHLKERGIEARVDHRTLDAQGIDRVPMVHFGPVGSAVERRGILALSAGGAAFFMESPMQGLYFMLAVSIIVAPAVMMAIWLVIWNFRSWP